MLLVPGSPTAHSPRPAKSPWPRVKVDGGVRRSLRRALTRNQERVIDSFRRIDQDDDGIASYADFSAALQALDLDADGARQLFAEICAKAPTSSKSPCAVRIGGSGASTFGVRELAAWLWAQVADDQPAGHSTPAKTPTAAAAAPVVGAAELALERGVRPASAGPRRNRGIKRFSAENVQGTASAADRFEFEAGKAAATPYHLQGDTAFNDPEVMA